MMLVDILIPLFAVGLAELGDKTQLSILLLSSKTRKHMQLFLGAMLAFLMVDGFAVLVGSWITEIIPENHLKIFSGTVFIAFGLLILKGKGVGDDGRLYTKNPLISGFALVFMTEWGDKTQIASALFATRYDTLQVLAGVMTALALLSITAIYLGKVISDKVDKKTMTKLAGIIFILMGASFLLL
jgi:putative Ca2+/H+ antiporter (TMEM165/GDT1 family)